MQGLLKTAAEEMLSKAIRTYTFNDLIVIGRHPYKSLPEMLAQYPNNGVGFKVWRKTWPENKFIIITEAHFKGLRNGKFFGIQYYNGRPLTPQPIKIRNCSKRGTWKYDTNNTSGVSTNGVYFSADDLKEYSKLHQNREQKE
ncbi:unnamed protein product (macronuclear) [Paramecium tetraurelia]|uniref:Uncharacterized protein n=1 Tax=Paramecium tetraurelia TaxID=5888 RepID=A0DNQ9_PARTE|nr:uncharacterized protein GSPATT00018872001 [Paramecium tetraurelia]CAK84676.1 unnamed protein product [Paramecium tetraurelia]|eukprot:XP_001452073.1 hypothetical protein (macronuclear) [Paramecium tetraurelia strain d4-2]